MKYNFGKYFGKFSKPVRLNWANVPEAPTCFCLCPINDPEFSPETLVLLVLNKAENKGRDGSDKTDVGKRQGFGEPGGGVNVESLDSLPGAAEREIEAETGLTASVKGAPLTEEHQLIISNKKTGGRHWRISYEKGKEPSVEIDSRAQVALRNPVYTFRGAPRWENSNLRKLFTKIRTEYIQNDPATEEFIKSCGMYFLVQDLSEEELASLAIEEIHEIDGIGIFTVSFLMEMLETKEPYLNNYYFYFSHLTRIKEGLAKIGMLPAKYAGGVA